MPKLLLAFVLTLGLNGYGAQKDPDDSLTPNSRTSVSPILPSVILTDLNASLDKAAVLLSWSTSRENHFSHFVLQRSLDGITFKDVAVIFGNEDSQPSTYSFKDKEKKIVKVSVYYRLLMVDQSLDAQLSPVVEVKPYGNK